MTSQTQSAPAAVLRASAGLRLLAWPALDASGADAAVTARSGGVSAGPYATLNLSPVSYTHLTLPTILLV